MSGDVVKTLGVNGSDVILSGGFFKTTTKRSTAVLYSLFASDWVGNMFVTGDTVMESGFQELHNATATIDVLIDIEDSAEQSLEWLIRAGDIKKVAAATRIIDGGIYITEIAFTELDDSITLLEVLKRPSYWEVRGGI